jgi:hypothetical protein
MYKSPNPQSAPPENGGVQKAHNPFSKIHNPKSAPPENGGVQKAHNPFSKIHNPKSAILNPLASPACEWYFLPAPIAPEALQEYISDDDGD